ncbi:type VII secretion protein EssA [Fictibacillus sp. Mic-4]|uniref:type VII secretion protein EssA n=1 Tax=Fictibacillus TaxID=1329200 RepID=UPI000429FEE3|nr:type VII secretion protein EssA [Fictibacillus gelatini]
MKGLMKLIKFIVLCSGIFLLCPLQTVLADELEHDGTIHWKSDRISQNESEKKKAESQSNKETELEKIAPDLFSEQTRAAIESKQRKNKQQMESIKHSLFVTPVKKDMVIKNSRKALFTDNYQAPFVAEPQSDEDGRSRGMSKTVTTILGGVALLICTGIYKMIRTFME